MPLHVKALEHDHREEFDGFYAIYSTAFPPSEQKPREVLLAMCRASFYTIYLAYNDEKIVGFCIMYHPWNEDFFLLEYMAVDETLRGIGLGSTLLKQSIEALYQNYGVRALLIEIDSPEKSSAEQYIREKREQFYRKLGCKKIDPFDYILPLKSDEIPPPMELLVYHPTLMHISREDLKRWLEILYSNVYGCDKDDARIEAMLEHTPPILNLI
ncbi:MAG TPA: GNAT family N-acetyltransferase [Sulfurospirillum cavolei]|uniref:GNAT family N-acetyltransferase n=1 Tax=Sulfurospirillum cavolei TaxID=366522 RepID=A0A2D3WG46_9BACT|nr:MAG TPA: GNAT family N-acetyltransferase [Sulfurospirillum cavolei]